MNRRGHGALDPNAAIERLIRRSRLLDPSLKRHWLRVLPYLTPADRQRLEEILRSENERADVRSSLRRGEG